MTDERSFEARLTRRLVAHADAASRPFDAGTIARAAVATTPRRTASPWRTALLVMGAAVLLVLGLTGAAIVGSSILRQPAPLPPGLLAIATNTGLVFAIADGSEPRVVDGGGPFFAPAWSPDGESLAAEALLTDDMNALRVYDDAGDLYGGASNVEAFAWSPDSRYLLIDEVDPFAPPGIVVTRNAPDPGEVVVPEGAVGFDGMDWLPDGRIVAAIRLAGEAEGESGLWILDLAADIATRMGSDAGRSGTRPAVSPDGSRIAMLTQRCDAAAACVPMIRIVDTATGQRRIDIETASGVATIDWTPDGAGIVADTFAMDGPRIFWWPFESGDGGALVDWEGPGVWLVGVTPDGKAALAHRYAADGATDEVWRVPLDGGAPTLLVTGATGAALQP